MQKVVGSSPIIRSKEKPRSGEVSCWLSCGRPSRTTADSQLLVSFGYASIFFCQDVDPWANGVRAGVQYPRP